MTIGNGGRPSEGINLMRLLRRLVLSLLPPLVAVVPVQAREPSASTETSVQYIEAGRLLADPATGRVAERVTIVVADGRVRSIEPGFVGNAAQGKVIMLHGSFVMPGLIDSHVHLTLQQSVSSALDKVTQSDADQALIGAGNAQRTLMAGFTTVADLGARNDAIFALRAGIVRGDVPGPRILAAGSMISAHGGHGDVNGYREELLHLLTPSTICSGADDCIKHVRLQIQAGADLIKVAVTGGVLSETATGLGQQLTDTELQSIVSAAHRLGRKVTAHAHGQDGIEAFLSAGGDSVEHGTFMDEKAVRPFKAGGAYLIPTLMAGDFVTRIASGADNFFSPAQRAKALQAGPQLLETVRLAHARGVRIAFGTDSGVSRHGDNAREFVLLVKAGLSPIDAVRAATINAAQHLGIERDAGRIEPSMPADIIAVDANPLIDVAALGGVRFVMRAGKVYRMD